jgi:hypothetical protein
MIDQAGREIVPQRLLYYLCHSVIQYETLFGKKPTRIILPWFRTAELKRDVEEFNPSAFAVPSLVPAIYGVALWWWDLDYIEFL